MINVQFQDFSGPNFSGRAGDPMVFIN